MRGKKRNTESNTGDVQPITFKDLQNRVNAIRSRNKIPQIRYTIESDGPSIFPPYPQKESYIKDMNDVESDQYSTNFNPQQPQVAMFRPTSKSIRGTSKNLSRKTVQFASMQIQKRRPMTSYKNSFRLVKGVNLNQTYEIKGQAQALIFKQQMGQFRNLYEYLAAILGFIKDGGVNQMEAAISDYIQYIQSKKFSFIDDFIEGREKKLQKVIRQARLHEGLSIAYLFLEMAQERIQNHECYLTNFIGYCLSNLLLTARLYIIKEGKIEFQESQFESIMKKVQIASFGRKLSSLDDVLLRLQHNNQIITMMHKKLGRFNPKFQLCIQLFFKNAQRKKTSCLQCTYYIFEYLALHIHQSDLVGISKCLQIAPVPYCPPPIKNYTLIIEPLGILISQGRTRPYLFQFLEWAHKHFDVVLWTWEMPYQPEIQKIYIKIDQYLTSKLYRYHCIQENNIYVKDLNRLGRNLDKVLIVDFDKRIYYRQPQNGMELRWKYNSQVKDKGLLYLCQILQEMVASDSCVEDMLKIYSEEVYNLKGY